MLRRAGVIPARAFLSFAKTSNLVLLFVGQESAQLGRGAASSRPKCKEKFDVLTRATKKDPQCLRA